LIYVPDVPAAVAFYEAAFDIKCRFVHESKLYAEMDTGETALGFAGNEMAEMNGVAIRPNEKSTLPAGWEICFITDDIDKAYAKSIKNGCTPISPPTDKPWGQKVSYVRDLNGCIVEIATAVQK